MKQTRTEQLSIKMERHPSVLNNDRAPPQQHPALFHISHHPAFRSTTYRHTDPRTANTTRRLLQQPITTHHLHQTSNPKHFKPSTRPHRWPRQQRSQVQEPPIPDKRLGGSLASATLSNTSSNMQCGGRQFELRSGYLIRSTTFPRKKFVCLGATILDAEPCRRVRMTNTRSSRAQ